MAEVNGSSLICSIIFLIKESPFRNVLEHCEVRTIGFLGLFVNCPEKKNTQKWQALIRAWVLAVDQSNTDCSSSLKCNTESRWHGQSSACDDNTITTAAWLNNNNNGKKKRQMHNNYLCKHTVTSQVLTTASFENTCKQKLNVIKPESTVSWGLRVRVLCIFSLGCTPSSRAHTPKKIHPPSLTRL